MLFNDSVYRIFKSFKSLAELKQLFFKYGAKTLITMDPMHLTKEKRMELFLTGTVFDKIIIEGVELDVMVQEEHIIIAYSDAYFKMEKDNGNMHPRNEVECL